MTVELADELAGALVPRRPVAWSAPSSLHSIAAQLVLGALVSSMPVEGRFNHIRRRGRPTPSLGHQRPRASTRPSRFAAAAGPA